VIRIKLMRSLLASMNTPSKTMKTKTPAMAALTIGLTALLAGQAFASALFPDCASGPLSNNTVCDTSASVSDRAKALVAVLTIEEKLNLTGNTSPGVPRLGLPAYQWWRE
jgi:beta-D-xylosidase 4